MDNYYKMKPESRFDNYKNSPGNENITAILVILYYFIGHIYFVPRLVLSILDNFMSYRDAVIYVQLFSDLIGFVIIVFLSRKYLLQMFNVFKKNISSTFTYAFALYLPQIMTNGVLNLIITSITQIETSTNQSAAVSLLTANVWALAIPAVLVAPVVEELVFRGMIFRYFRRFGFKIAAFVSCFTFGFLHCLNDFLTQNYMGMLFIITYMGMSFYFCYAYEKSHNIYSPILLHFINNLIAIIMLVSI